MTDFNLRFKDTDNILQVSHVSLLLQDRIDIHTVGLTLEGISHRCLVGFHLEALVHLIKVGFSLNNS